MGTANPCFALLWIILLIVIVWPISILVSIFWIILQPFEACCRCIRGCNDCLERIVEWPRKCGEAIRNCHSACPEP
jgi:hypothetical protein